MNTFCCPYCPRSFADQSAVYQHARVKHRREKIAHLKPARKSDDEESMADIAVEAEQKRSAGEPLDVMEITQYTATAEIVMHKGPKPAGDMNAFDAREVLQHLSQDLHRPSI